MAPGAAVVTTVSATSDATREIARAVVSVGFEDLQPHVVKAAKRSVLDTLGVTLAATGLAGEDVLAIAPLCQEWGGRPESSLIGHSQRVPAYLAAFVFGALGHALDYDDIVQEAVVHPTAPTLAAALPLAERLGGVDGRTLLTAIALGVDVTTRLGLAIGSSPVAHGWLPSTPGVFGAAVASAKVLNLDEEGVCEAIGLALHQAGGTAQCAFGTGSSFRAIRDGFNAKAGLLAALLAERGVHGGGGALEGRFGFFNLHFGGDYDRAVLLDGLGTRFAGERVGYKAWPCCGYSQFFLTALQRLLDREKLSADDVDHIVAVGGDDLLRAQCEPLAERVRPDNVIDAKFSLPFQLGKLLTRGTIQLGDFTAAGLRDLAAIAVAERVEWRVDPSLGGKFGPGLVEVCTVDGRVRRERADQALGHPSLPLSWEQLVAKFHDCARHAAESLSDERVCEAIDVVARLEDLPDVGAILPLLAPEPVAPG